MTEVTRIELDTRSAQRYAQSLTLAPEIARDEFEDGVREALLLLEREVKERTPVGVGGAGGLRGSVTHQLQGQAIAIGAGVVGKVFSPLRYAIPVELGTKPHFPPLRPLEDWVVAKLGVPRDQAGAVAFLVARKIARRGTEGAHMFEDALSDNARKILRILEAAVARIFTRLGS